MHSMAVKQPLNPLVRANLALGPYLDLSLCKAGQKEAVLACAIAHVSHACATAHVSHACSHARCVYCFGHAGGNCTQHQMAQEAGAVLSDCTAHGAKLLRFKLGLWCCGRRLQLDLDYLSFRHRRFSIACMHQGQGNPRHFQWLWSWIAMMLQHVHANSLAGRVLNPASILSCKYRESCIQARGGLACTKHVVRCTLDRYECEPCMFWHAQMKTTHAWRWYLDHLQHILGLLSKGKAM